MRLAGSPAARPDGRSKLAHAYGRSLRTLHLLAHTLLLLVCSALAARTPALLAAWSPTRPSSTRLPSTTSSSSRLSPDSELRDLSSSPCSRARTAWCVPSSVHSSPVPDPPLTLSTAQDEPLLPTRASSPTPSQQQQHRPRPLSTTTRALLALAAVTLTLYLLAAPSSTRSTPALAPLEAHHAAAAHPAERLAQLNSDYDPHREGYGVGSTDLRAYAAGLRRTLAQVLARGSGEGRAQGAMPDDDDEERDGLAPPLVDDDALVDALECRLALDGRECPAAARAIPPDLYATARTVSPVPSALQSWLGGGASASPLRLHLLSSEAIVAFIARRFPALSQAYAALPIPILRYDLFRLVVLAARGGVYTDADTRLLRPFPRAEWPADVDDRTDPALRLASSSLSGNSTAHADAPPALVIGLEWASSSPARAQENARNALYNREAGVVQWTFGAAAGHPVLLDAVRRVLRHTERVAALEGEGEGAGEGEGEGEGVGGDEERWKEDGVDEGPLQFDPRAERMVLEWSGPAVLTDSVARCAHSLSLSLPSPSSC